MEGRERDQRKAVLLFSFIVSVEMGESVDKNNKIQSFHPLLLFDSR